MFVFDRRTAAWIAAWVAAGIMTPALAADTGRLDMLATEAAQFAAAPSPADAATMTWAALGALVAATMLAASCGTYLATRRMTRVASRGKGWREVTYRFKSGKPMRLKHETLSRLSGLLGDLEDLGSDLRKVNGAATENRDDPDAESPRRVTFRRRRPPVPATPAAPARGRRADREDAYRRARRLLADGHDAAMVRDMTGLKAIEVDLLRAVPAAGPTVRRGRAHVNVSRGPVGGEE